MFRKSSKCSSGACVEVDTDAEPVIVRNPTSGVFVAFSREEWACFIDAVKANEFDVEVGK